MIFVRHFKHNTQYAYQYQDLGEDANHKDILKPQTSQQPWFRGGGVGAAPSPIPWLNLWLQTRDPSLIPLTQYFSVQMLWIFGAGQFFTVQDCLMCNRTIRIPAPCLLIDVNIPYHCDIPSNLKLIPNICSLRTPCGVIRDQHCRQLLVSGFCVFIHEKANCFADWMRSPVHYIAAMLAGKLASWFLKKKKNEVQRYEETCAR